MQQLDTDLKQFCFLAPRWMQLEIQGFWYGLVSWTLTCAEDKRTADPSTVKVADLLEHSDAEFSGWPTDWLEPKIQEFTNLQLNYDEQNSWLEQLDSIFHDCIPADLNIFSTLAEGEHISEEQWLRLYDALAFEPPSQQSVGFHRANKTVRPHQKRGITPIKRRKVYTRHNKHTVFVTKTG